MWRIWWATNNASRWQMGFNSAFKGLNIYLYSLLRQYYIKQWTYFNQIPDTWMPGWLYFVWHIVTIIITVFPLHTKMYISSFALTRKDLITVRFRDHSQKCGSSVWSQRHVTLLSPRIWRWVLVFWKIFRPPLYAYKNKLNTFSPKTLTYTGCFRRNSKYFRRW
jgi:hypothetical protein